MAKSRLINNFETELPKVTKYKMEDIKVGDKVLTYQEQFVRAVWGEVIHITEKGFKVQEQHTKHMLTAPLHTIQNIDTMYTEEQILEARKVKHEPTE